MGQNFKSLDTNGVDACMALEDTITINDDSFCATSSQCYFLITFWVWKSNDEFKQYILTLDHRLRIEWIKLVVLNKLTLLWKKIMDTYLRNKIKICVLD